MRIDRETWAASICRRRRFSSSTWTTLLLHTLNRNVQHFYCPLGLPGSNALCLWQIWGRGVSRDGGSCLCTCSVPQVLRDSFLNTSRGDSSRKGSLQDKEGYRSPLRKGESHCEESHQLLPGRAWKTSPNKTLVFSSP